MIARTSVHSVTIEEPGAWPAEDVVVEFERSQFIGEAPFEAECFQ